MPFDQAAIQKIETWQKSKGSKLVCVGCGQRNKWKIGKLAGLLHVDYPTPQTVNLSQCHFDTYVPIE